MKLASVSIRRPVFAVMLIGSLVVLGTVSLGRLQVALNPDVEFPYVSVSTWLRGAAPETIESEVTDPIEEQVNTIEGIRTLSSMSSQGLSTVMVEFDLEVDIARKTQEVRDKVAAARSNLPIDAEDPLVQQLDPDAGAILSVMLSGNVSVRELSDFADRKVKSRLERLSGVGNVRVVGSRKREVRIWVDPLRLAGYGLAVEDVSAMLRRENAELAGGSIEGATREWSVTTAGKVSSIHDFGSLIVAQRGGHLVYLRDVAVVEDGLEDERSIARLNGQRGVSLEVRRRSGSNTVAVAQAVRAEVAEISTRLPPGMQIYLASDLAVFVEAAIDGVFDDMLLGGFLAVAVVLLFLRSPRSTLIAAVAIPTSIISSFTLVYMAGFTLNTMTLMALSLAVGLVIDDAIVVVENVVRHIERGEPPVVSAEIGTSEVALAVVSTTAAVCAVFVPIAFMSGMIGVWFYEFGLVVAFAVCVSTLVALTLTPMLASRLLTGSGVSENALFRAIEAGHRSMERGFERVVTLAMRFKGRTVAVAVLCVLGGCGVAGTLPSSFFTSSDRGEFRVAFRLPLGTPLNVSDRVARRAEAVIAEQPEVRAIFSTVGSGIQQNANEVGIYVGVSPKGERSTSIKTLMANMREHVAAALPEAEEVRVEEISWFSSGARVATLMYTLRGPDLERLERSSARMVALMQADPGLVDVASSHETGRPEIDLELDRDRAADLGVAAVTVGRTIRTLLAGEEVGTFEEDARRIDVRLRVLPEYRDDPSKLDLIQVRGIAGDLIPITNVARPRVGEGAVEIRRQNRARQITLYANLSEGTPLGDMTAKMDAWAAEVGIEAPDELVPSGQARAMREATAGIIFAFVMALTAIYMILASLYNSILQPLVIMISAPLSFIGGFLGLALFRMPIELMSMIGLLVLMGLVMKNGILVVDFANQLRSEGYARDDAALRAAVVRMRPVLMTTAALVCGLLPVAFGVTANSEFRRPLGVITVGGLLTSTPLTLIFVPVFYTLVDSFGQRIRRLASRVLPSAVNPEAGSAGAYEKATGIGGG